jgi:serine/threonine protein kinase
MDPGKLNAAVLRDYTDFHLLGEGGFGKVYLATCAATGEVRQFLNTLLFG